MVTSLIVFSLLLRSVVLPVLAVVVNLLTIAMSYGMVGAALPGHRLREDPALHLDRRRSTLSYRVVMLCILFGITMDYAVFMLTRMHERWHRTRDNRESVTTGLIRTGRIIVSAALLVVIVTGAFAFTSIGQTKMLGLGIALAIIVDTVLIRLTLLPAVMAYLGRANWWWPGFEWMKGLGRKKSPRPRTGPGTARPTGRVNPELPQ